MRASHPCDTEIPFERAAPSMQPTHAKEDAMRSLLRLWQWWLEQRELARTRRELNELSEHLLKDVGLRRGAIGTLFR
jgi:uncharacterized protein YjiS (DUF1127 family)